VNNLPFERSPKMSWIASLMTQLREEILVAPLDLTGRAHIAGIHVRSVSPLEQRAWP
jgi:hypothetical protein